MNNFSLLCRDIISYGRVRPCSSSTALITKQAATGPPSNVVINWQHNRRSFVEPWTKQAQFGFAYSNVSLCSIRQVTQYLRQLQTTAVYGDYWNILKLPNVNVNVSNFCRAKLCLSATNPSARSYLRQCWYYVKTNERFHRRVGLVQGL